MRPHSVLRVQNAVVAYSIPGTGGDVSSRDRVLLLTSGDLVDPIRRCFITPGLTPPAQTAAANRRRLSHSGAGPRDNSPTCTSHNHARSIRPEPAVLGERVAELADRQATPSRMG